jgi:hypothetical protein
MIRSFVAVVGGIATLSAALFAMMAAGNAIVGAEPEWINRSVVTQFVWLAWNVVSMAAGGYVTAWIASTAKTAHSIVMGSIQTAFTLVALLTVTDRLTPLWLWIGGIVTTVPAAWVGARLRRT